MSTPDELPELRLAPAGTPEQLARHLERERRAENQQREDDLEQSLAGYRVGTVPFLNGVPLIRGIENEVIYATPSKLAEMLQRDELDAALVSVTEVLFHDRYDVLDGVAIASLGEVKSVYLAHRQPIEKVTEVFCDPASLTSVNLLRVLLAERGVEPAFQALPGYDFAALPDFALLIGDIALDFARGSHAHQIWDLGTAWYELTSLPFVYAVWAIRRGFDTTRLRRVLRQAKDFGIDTLDHIIRTRPEYDFEFRNDYLGWHIHFHLGSDEKRGLARFIELLHKHGLGPVHEPHFVA